MKSSSSLTVRDKIPVMMPVFAAKATWELWKYNTSTEGGLRPLGNSPICLINSISVNHRLELYSEYFATITTTK